MRSWIRSFPYIARILRATLLAAFVSSSGFAQIKVAGGFLSDSIKVGEQTAFYLSARYPSNLIILFPDSTHSFFPFEFRKKKYFNTESAGGVSADSTLYYLTTFEIDSLLALSLPAYVVNDQDCTVYISPADTIRIVQTVKENIDSIAIEKLPLKMSTAYYGVKYEFNHLMAGIIAGMFILACLLVWILFGKKIKRHLAAKRLRKRHRQFMEGFNSILNQLQTAFSPSSAETALSLWKKYMEQLDAKPYTKLTTRETVEISNDETLGKNLRAMDRAIYGHEHSIAEPLTHLRTIADEKFTKKLKEVMHGK